MIEKFLNWVDTLPNPVQIIGLLLSVIISAVGIAFLIIIFLQVGYTKNVTNEKIITTTYIIEIQYVSTKIDTLKISLNHGNSNEFFIDEGFTSVTTYINNIPITTTNSYSNLKFKTGIIDSYYGVKIEKIETIKNDVIEFKILETTNCR